MMIGRGKLRGFASAALGASLLAAAPAGAAAESTAAFFQGKQVRFYTMGGPGGGYDTYMRALIPHLEKKLGARMLPTNEPGAGGLIAVNRTVNAPPDGLTLLLVGTVVEGSNAAGGYDTFARAVARYMGKHIPGSPT